MTNCCGTSTAIGPLGSPMSMTNTAHTEWTPMPMDTKQAIYIAPSESSKLKRALHLTGQKEPNTLNSKLILNSSCEGQTVSYTKE